MNKKLKLFVNLFLVIIVLYLLSNFLIKQNEKNMKNNLKDYDWVNNHLKIEKEEDYGSNIYVVKGNHNIKRDNDLYKKAVDEKITELKEIAYYKLNKPLLILNPYESDELNLYVFFETDTPSIIEYTISIKSDLKIKDYSAKSSKESDYSNTHEFEITGIKTDEVNEVELKKYDEDGNIETYKLIVDLLNEEK